MIMLLWLIGRASQLGKTLSSQQQRMDRLLLFLSWTAPGWPFGVEKLVLTLDFA